MITSKNTPRQDNKCLNINSITATKKLLSFEECKTTRYNKNQKQNYMKKMHAVVHFEMPAEDRKRMAEFYSNVFGWQTQMLGEEMGNYVTATTTETDENGRPKMPGTINGGFYPLTEDSSASCPSIVIATDDINESIKKISETGGEVLSSEPTNIPGIGLYISFIDTEGNRVGLLQPVMNRTF